MQKFLLVALGAACVVYILNPSFGLFEFLPDNLPVVGNLDEAAATGILIAVWRQLRRPPLPGKSSVG